MWTPTAACVAPGPRVTRQIPGRPVSFPYASAAFAAPCSWRQVMSRDRRVVERVEHGQVALAREAEREVGAVQLELVDEDLAAGPHSGTSRRIVARLEPRRVLVGRIDVADRPASRPLGREEQHADEGGVLGRGGGREHRVVGALEPRLARAVRSRLAVAAVDRQLAVQDPADSRPGMHVPVGDAARREVDAVETRDPRRRRRRPPPPRPRRPARGRAAPRRAASRPRARARPDAVASWVDGESAKINGSTGRRR